MPKGPRSKTHARMSSASLVEMRTEEKKCAEYQKSIKKHMIIRSMFWYIFRSISGQPLTLPNLDFSGLARAGCYFSKNRPEMKPTSFKNGGREAPNILPKNLPKPLKPPKNHIFTLLSQMSNRALEIIWLLLFMNSLTDLFIVSFGEIDIPNWIFALIIFSDSYDLLLHY